MRGEPSTKTRGDDALEGPASLDDLLDEAIAESFPCSDPPAYTSLHAGSPTPLRPPIAIRSPASVSAKRRFAGIPGILIALSGLWPIVHLRSFNAVMGPKRDKRIVRAAGLLVSSVGAALFAVSRRRAVDSSPAHGRDRLDP